MNFLPHEAAFALPPRLLQLLDQSLMYLLVRSPILLHPFHANHCPHGQGCCLECWPPVMERLIWRDTDILQDSQIGLVARDVGISLCSKCNVKEMIERKNNLPCSIHLHTLKKELLLISKTLPEALLTTTSCAQVLDLLDHAPKLTRMSLFLVHNGILELRDLFSLDMLLIE